MPGHHRSEPTAAAAPMTAAGSTLRLAPPRLLALAVPALVVAYLVGRRAGRAVRPTRGRRCLFVLRRASSWLWPFTWPLGDLAAHWLLLALVLQRLAAHPGRAAPPRAPARPGRSSSASPARPGRRRAARRRRPPVPAVAIVTVVAVGTLTPARSSLAARSTSPGR